MKLQRTGAAPVVERVAQAATMAGTVCVGAVQRLTEDPSLGKKPTARWDAAGQLKLMWATRNEALQDAGCPR